MLYLGIPFLLAFIDWAALAAGWKTVDLLAKPATMVALYAWTWLLTTPGEVPDAVQWVRIGILFSLFGDILFLPVIDRFLTGLIAFLLGHLAYIVALNHAPPLFDYRSALLALAIGGLAWAVGRRIQAGLQSGGKNKLRIPVLLYSTVITVMLISAWLTTRHPDWPGRAAWLVASGATLFVLSDVMLAWNRFVAPLPNARLLVRIPYHLGQIGITLGIVLS